MAKMHEPQQKTPPKQPIRPSVPRPAGDARRYFREVQSELSKVIWPTREQTWNLTLVVLSVMVGMGLLLGLLDFLFGGLIQLLTSLV